MQLKQPKQYQLLAGTPMLVHTVRAFADSSCINRIIVVVAEEWLDNAAHIFKEYGLDSPRLTITAGGQRRQDSVRAGLLELNDNISVVLVHDGARPLVSQQIILSCYETALRDGAAIAAVPMKDTIKKIRENSVISTLNRTELWQAQTPQAARYALLVQAFKNNGNADVTDEASLLEKNNIPITVVAGSETNIKITRPEDMELASAILREKTAMKIRIGHGYDAHKFAQNRKLVLGGITIPNSRGLKGHSDADVLTHALCDAILGALAMGDIGHHFPDNNDDYKDIYSITLLEKVISQLEHQSFSIANIDITVICQTPRLSPYLGEMRNLLAKTCKLSDNTVNIKATTTEQMGFTGRKEGISCHAVVLLQSYENRNNDFNNQ